MVDKVKKTDLFSKAMEYAGKFFSVKVDAKKSGFSFNGMRVYRSYSNFGSGPRDTIHVKVDKETLYSFQSFASFKRFVDKQ